MKSKIQIALDEDNQPIIKIDYYYSEDVRDDMVKRFLQSHGNSTMTDFRYLNHNPDYVNSAARLRPTNTKDMHFTIISSLWAITTYDTETETLRKELIEKVKLLFEQLHK